MERNRQEAALYGTGATFMRSSGQTQAAHLRGEAVGEAMATLTLWQGRRRSRQQLADLSDQMLQDIGITRAEVEREYGKPFWRA
jgi:uncharacterized protein YjiS (DUF1127 family)